MEKDLINSIAKKKNVDSKVIEFAVESMLECVVDTISNDEYKSIKLPVIGKWMPNMKAIEMINIFKNKREDLKTQLNNI